MSEIFEREIFEREIKAMTKEENYISGYKAGKSDVLDKLRAEIAEYGSICAEYKMTGRSDKDIEQLVTDVLKQAKKQVLDVIDKYKAEIEEAADDKEAD